jgi:L-arabinokinase
MLRSLRPVSFVPTSVPDLARFVADVAARVEAGAWGTCTTAPDDREPVFVARAPGRLDLMGGIADYSGALVLQWPIREATRVALRRWPEPRVSILSIAPGGVERRCDVPLDVVADPERPIDEVRGWFAADSTRHWAAYVAGVLHVLVREHGAVLSGGATILVESDVPEGKGVSSSAALEAATMEAAIAAWQVRTEPRTRAVRCQQVENHIVGAPCGVMDQMASICGEEGALMALLCQPAELQGSLRLPEGLGVWGIDSGIRHAVTGADYGAVRVGAFMGYRILAHLAGLRATPGARVGHVQIEDTRWRGYLANVGREAFERFAPRIPEMLDGGAFLARYQGTTDLVTQVDPARRYAVRTPAAHPVYEHERVSEWARCLTALASTSASQHDAERLGALMYESHDSYSACGLGSDGTDRLVALAREAGAQRDIYGAKITGGGSGGTVALLADAGSGTTIRAIARRYAQDSGRDAYVFEGSSPGAARIGSIRLDFK